MTVRKCAVISTCNFAYVTVECAFGVQVSVCRRSAGLYSEVIFIWILARFEGSAILKLFVSYRRRDLSYAHGALGA